MSGAGGLLTLRRSGRISTLTMPSECEGGLASENDGSESDHESGAFTTGKPGSRREAAARRRPLGRHCLDTRTGAHPRLAERGTCPEKIRPPAKPGLRRFLG